MLLAPGGGETATEELFALIGVIPGKELDEALCEGVETGCDCTLPTACARSASKASDAISKRRFRLKADLFNVFRISIGCFFPMLAQSTFGSLEE